MFSIFLDFAIYLIPTGIMSLRININAKCGIPMTNWITVLLLIICFSNLQKLFMLIVVQRCRTDRFVYGIFSSGLVFTVLFAWLIYGNILYYSRQNDCLHIKQTRLLSHLMLAYLYVGYIQIGYALSYVYVIPHAIMKWWSLASRRAQFRAQIQQISQTLARKDYDPIVHKFETVCAICLDEFDKTATVTTLECHTKHIFHSQCLDRWILQEHNTCPVCRDEIIPAAIDRQEYDLSQRRVVNDLARDEDVQRLAECPFGWPF